MSIEAIIGLVVGAFNIGFLTFVLLHINKQQSETTTLIQTTTKELQSNATVGLDSILSCIKENRESIAHSIDELKTDQLLRFENLRHSLDTSINILKAEVSQMHGVALSELKSSHEKHMVNLKTVIAEIEKLREDVVKFRQYLDEAVTI
ncbi:MAG: hypothetical protein WCH46_01905 [bacterium]